MTQSQNRTLDKLINFAAGQCITLKSADPDTICAHFNRLMFAVDSRADAQLVAVFDDIAAEIALHHQCAIQLVFHMTIECLAAGCNDSNPSDISDVWKWLDDTFRECAQNIVECGHVHQKISTPVFSVEVMH